MVGQTDLFRTRVTPLLSPALPHPPALPRRQGGPRSLPALPGGKAVENYAPPPYRLTAVSPGAGEGRGSCELWAAQCVTWVRAENLPRSQQ